MRPLMPPALLGDNPAGRRHHDDAFWSPSSPYLLIYRKWNVILCPDCTLVTKAARCDIRPAIE